MGSPSCLSLGGGGEQKLGKSMLLGQPSRQRASHLERFGVKIWKALLGG